MREDSFVKPALAPTGTYWSPHTASLVWDFGGGGSSQKRARSEVVEVFVDRVRDRGVPWGGFFALAAQNSFVTLMESICVYCGSNFGRIEDYKTAAKELAKSLVERKMRLVYGGANVGIMGFLADSVLQLGGEVVGVIPEALTEKEIAHENLTELHITQSMHERKTLMAELADGFIALPGGIGTLEELFEAWTWGQLGLHRKPCGLLNTNGYYDYLTMFLDHTVKEEFVKQPHRSMLIFENDPDLLLDRLVAYEAPNIGKWI